jgi:SnoaL-like domain
MPTGCAGRASTVRDDPLGEQMRALLDEQRIRSILHRYCRAADRLDISLMRSCYHDDASDEHGSFAGGADAYVEWAFGLLTRYTWTMHLLANIMVEVRGDVALAESYGIAFHRTDSGPGNWEPRLNLTTGFRFIDRFERRRGDWRIAKRVATTEWSRVDDLAGRWSVPNRLRTGARDRSDPVWWLVPEVTAQDGEPKDGSAGDL